MARYLEETIMPALSLPVTIDGQQLQISFKAGIAVAPGDGRDAETLFKNVEATLKSAKQSGERYLFYAPEMNALIAEKLTPWPSAGSRWRSTGPAKPSTTASSSPMMRRR